MTAVERDTFAQSLGIVLDSADALRGLDPDTARRMETEPGLRLTVSGFLRKARLGADEALRAMGEERE